MTLGNDSTKYPWVMWWVPAERQYTTSDWKSKWHRLDGGHWRTWCGRAVPGRHTAVANVLRGNEPRCRSCERIHEARPRP